MSIAAANMPLFNRPDTMLGICEGIGREFGFHPNILRVALAIPLVWNPLVAIGIYLALGIALATSRILMPARRSTVTTHPAVVLATSTSAPADPEVALAA